MQYEIFFHESNLRIFFFTWLIINELTFGRPEVRLFYPQTENPQTLMNNSNGFDHLMQQQAVCRKVRYS